LKAVGSSATPKELSSLEAITQAYIEQGKKVQKSLDELPASFEEIRQSVYEQSRATTQEIHILWDKKEDLEKQLREQRKKQDAAEKEPPPPPPPPPQKPPPPAKRPSPYWTFFYTASF